ncbi:MAG: hypothetical protein AAF974_03430, partial [Cyanobacteria bacterium P01_E01_bin.34]
MPENKIQPQLQKLWNVVSKEETRNTYINTIAVTAEIVKETAILSWYFILLVLVGSDSLVMFSRKTVHNVRQLVSGLDNSKSVNDIASDTGKALATAGQGAVSSLLSQARTQLGLPERSGLELPPLEEKIAEPVPVAAPPAAEPEPAVVEPQLASTASPSEPVPDEEESSPEPATTSEPEADASEYASPEEHVAEPSAET